MFFYIKTQLFLGVPLPFPRSEFGCSCFHKSRITASLLVFLATVLIWNVFTVQLSLICCFLLIVFPPRLLSRNSSTESTCTEMRSCEFGISCLCIWCRDGNHDDKRHGGPQQSRWWWTWKLGPPWPIYTVICQWIYLAAGALNIICNSNGEGRQEFSLE